MSPSPKDPIVCSVTKLVMMGLHISTIIFLWVNSVLTHGMEVLHWLFTEREEEHYCRCSIGSSPPGAAAISSAACHLPRPAEHARRFQSALCCRGAFDWRPKTRKIWWPLNIHWSGGELLTDVQNPMWSLMNMWVLWLSKKILCIYIVYKQYTHLRDRVIKLDSHAHALSRGT